MDSSAIMNKSEQSQQFNLRVLLVVGLLWGGALLVQLLLFFMTYSVVTGNKGTPVYMAAFLFNCVTLGPACVLAFWRRRLACVWIVLDALLAIASVLLATPREPSYGPAIVVSPIVPILLAAALVFIELRRWPGALER